MMNFLQDFKKKSLRCPKRGALTLLLLGLLVSCGTGTPIAQQSPSPTESPSPSESPSPEPSESASTAPEPSQSPAASMAPASTPASPAAPVGTVPVQIYRPDSSYENLIPVKTNLPKDRAMDAAIGQIIQTSNSPDFTVVGYRVKVQGAIATIDLRLDPKSTRHFESMSSAEQMALFGSLRKTLTSHASWGIQDVKFTDGKSEIVL